MPRSVKVLFLSVPALFVAQKERPTVDRVRKPEPKRAESSAEMKASCPPTQTPRKCLLSTTVLL